MAVTTVNGRKATVAQLRSWHKRFKAGQVSKIQLERDHFGTDSNRGKLVQRLWDQQGIR